MNKHDQQRNRISDPKGSNRVIKAQAVVFSFTGEIYQAFKEELILILHKCFQKLEDKEMLLNSFYEASNILSSSHIKHKKIKKIELQTSISQECEHKTILNNILANSIQPYIKKIIQHEQLEFSQERKLSLIFENPLV